MIHWLLMWLPPLNGEVTPIPDVPLPAMPRSGADLGALPTWRRRQE